MSDYCYDDGGGDDGNNLYHNIDFVAIFIGFCLWPFRQFLQASKMEVVFECMQVCIVVMITGVVIMWRLLLAHV